MGRYYYPNVANALEAKIQFLREHHYKIRHCFKNDGGKGYVLFDTRGDVNEWYKPKSVFRITRLQNVSKTCQFMSLCYCPTTFLTLKKHPLRSRGQVCNFLIQL